MRRISSAALALLLIPCSTAGQDRPDFSGTWAAVPDPAAPARAPLAYGQQFTISHQGQRLTVTRTFTFGPATVVYTLDGSQATSRMPGRLCEADSGAIWTASWDGPAIAIALTGAVPPNGKPIAMDVKSVLRLQGADSLSVEMTSRVAGATEPRVTSTMYKRAPAAPAVAGPAPAKAKASMSDVAWISGIWSGSSKTTTFEERWTPSAGGSMIGVSRTLRDGLMSAFEFLCIVERDGSLVYQAMPHGRMPATDFTLTKIDADSALFENPTHDFPTMIRYSRRPDGSLEAVVSGPGGQKPLTYVFKRQD
jgi:hypothetical protein